MKRTLLPVLAGALLLTSAHADERHADNRNLWLNYVGDHSLFDSKWGLHLEVQNRLIAWGVDGIFSDFPERVRAIREADGFTSES